MIIFKKDHNYFCILDNPKCGSSLLRSVLYPQIAKKYEVISNIGRFPVRKSGYDSIKYVHCNLKGAICFLKAENIDVNKVIFITTVRNPIDRLLSSYYYELKIKKKKKWKYDTITEDLKCFLEWDHIKHFYPKKFRFYLNYKINELVNLENIQSDFTYIIKKYNLDLDTTKLNKVVNKCNYKNINIPENLKNLIYERYELDFKEGKYKLHT